MPSFLHWIVFTVKKKISWAYLCGCILDSIQICWSIYPPANTTGLKNIYLFVLGLSCGIWELVPWPGIKPRPPALGAQSLSHWTTREVSHFSIVLFFSFWYCFSSFPSSDIHVELVVHWMFVSLLKFIEALTSSVAVFEHGDCKEVEKVTWGHKDGSLTQ